MSDALFESEFITNDTHFFGRERHLQAAHPLIPKVQHYIRDDEDPTRLAATKTFVRGHGVLLHGETGNGKTEHVKWMCSELYAPLYQVQGRSDLTFDDLVGDYRPNTDAKEKAPFVFAEGSLSLAVRNGGVFLLDEAASVKQGVLNGLNELLNGGDLVINTDRGHRVIPRHDDFQIAMTLNPWDRYSGNQELNIAFLNRFHVFEWDFLSPSNELKMLQQLFQGMQMNNLRNLVGFAKEIRDAKKANPDSVRYVISHRDMIKVLDQVKLGATLRQAIDLVVLSVVRLCAYDEFPVIRQMADNKFGTD